MLGLRVHLTLLVLSALLPALALGGLLSWRIADSYRTAARARLQDTARALAMTLDAEFDSGASLLKGLSASPQLDPGAGADGLAPFRVRATELAEARDTWIGLHGPAPDYRFRMNTRLPAGQVLDRSLALPPAARAALEAGRPFIGPFGHGVGSERWRIPLKVPVMRDGRVAGVLSLALTPERLTGILQRHGLSGDVFASLYDPRGIIVATSRNGTRYANTPAPAWIDEAAGDQESGVLRGPSLRGVDSLIGFARVAAAPGWTVVVGQPFAAYVAAWQRPLLHAMAGAAALLLVVFVLAGLLARALLRPVRAMASRATAAMAGEFAAPAPVPATGVAEFDAIARALAEAEAVKRRRRAEEEAEREHLRSVVETAVDGIIVADARGRIVRANTAAVLMFGYGGEADLAGQRLEVLMPPGAEPSHVAYLAGRKDGSPARAVGVPGRELRARRADGSVFPIELSVGSFQAHGERYFTGILRDATERKATEESRDLLAREVDHRAKNVLAVVLSLLRLAPRTTSCEEFVATAEGRVCAMARAHALLAIERWQGVDLRALVRDSVPAHAGQIELDGPDARLDAKATQPMALVLNELATNAAKYGALSAAAGRVRIAWSVDPAGGGFVLDWTEGGGPVLAGPPGRTGFGSQFVRSLITTQLGGTLALDWATAGLRARLSLPSDCVAAGAAGGRAPQAAPAQPCDAEAAPLAGPEARRRRILVVEDESLIAMELVEIFHGLGHEVVGPARSLPEAVSLASGAEDLAMAVLDVNLAGEQVFPVVDILVTRGIPYVFATGYGGGSSLQGHEGRAVAVLRKPFRCKDLALAVTAALERAPA